MSELLPPAVDCQHLTYRYGKFTAVLMVLLGIITASTLLRRLVS